jgi:tartrate dehydratase alpha subunit/fumarate hydratase class I-like protein
VTDAVDSELAELRRRIVDPVVEAVLTADELESVVVFEERTGHEVRATVVARGEPSYHYLQMQRSLPAADEELAGMAARFASELEDFVAESGFA